MTDRTGVVGLGVMGASLACNIESTAIAARQERWREVRDGTFHTNWIAQ